MITTVVFQHLTYISVITWNSDSIGDSSAISSRKSVRNDVNIIYNSFSGRYNVDTGYGIFETDSVALTDCWMHELEDTVVLPEFEVVVHGTHTELKISEDTLRLGLYRLNDAERKLVYRMNGGMIPPSLK